MVKVKRLKKRDIYRQLLALDVNVDYQTVRAWTTPSLEDDRVPAKWEYFQKLADVIGCGIPESELRRLYDAIRLLRVWHRKTGRDIVRMMRAARTGSLDPTGLRRVEERFGVSVRELVEATRIVEIDDILPED
jgi:hypothetical protein